MRGRLTDQQKKKKQSGSTEKGKVPFSLRRRVLLERNLGDDAYKSASRGPDALLAAMGSRMSVLPWATCVAMLRRRSDQSAGGEAPFSVAVWVGIIARAGVAAVKDVVMFVYLGELSERRIREGRMATAHDRREVIREGAE